MKTCLAGRGEHWFKSPLYQLLLILQLQALDTRLFNVGSALGATLSGGPAAAICELLGPMVFIHGHIG